MEHVEFDGKVYWSVDMEQGQWSLPNDKSLAQSLREQLLPSDTTLRDDYPYLVSKDHEEAEQRKQAIED